MRAILLGGTGAIGGATAMLLAENGWSVDVTGRDHSRMPSELTQVGVRFHQVERNDTRGVERLIGAGADLLVDLVAYTASDVRALLPSMSFVDCPVLVSSRAVYVDGLGHHINGAVAPRFEGPLHEDAPTVEPARDDADPFTARGYAACKVAAEQAALNSNLPITVLRPSKIHGRWARNARTRGIVQQMYQGAEVIKLVGADTVDHLTAALNAAALIAVVAKRPSRRVLNSADPDTPSAEDIVGAIAH